MSELDFNQVVASNIKRYMAQYDITQVDLARRLNVSTTTLYNWLNAIKTPRTNKIDMMCEIFHCKRSDLTVDYSEKQEAEARKETLLRMAEYHIKALTMYNQLKFDDQKIILRMMEAMLISKEDKDAKTT